LCAIVGWILSAPFGPSEFSGGTVTGPLLAIHDGAGYLFLLAVVVSFVHHRFAAGVALVACVLSLPLYVYVTAPGPFRLLVPGEYAVPLQANFAWNTWAVVGLCAVAMAASVSAVGLWTRSIARGT
jgi:hypothetical protein